jgi:hypothetical protein
MSELTREQKEKRTAEEDKMHGNCASEPMKGQDCGSSNKCSKEENLHLERKPEINMDLVQEPEKKIKQDPKSEPMPDLPKKEKMEKEAKELKPQNEQL